LKEKKTRTSISPKYLENNFELDRSSRSREKGGKPRFFPSKIGFEEKPKTVKFLFVLSLSIFAHCESF
jgi:hypothetical protein